MKKRVLAVVLVAVMTVAMAIPALALSPGGGGVYVPPVEEEEEEHHSSSKKEVWWAPAPAALTDIDALNSFTLWNLLLNGGKSTIVAAQMGNSGVDQWKFSSIFFTPGSNVAVFQGFPTGNVVETDTKADVNNTATVDKLVVDGVKSSHAAAGLKVGAP